MGKKDKNSMEKNKNKIIKKNISIAKPCERIEEKKGAK
jgi:hypothetical protein